ncbi:GAL4 enhancer protein [Naganishia albida]|nr:GAL4 enhancer protein [Naganishia albida]
MSIEDLSIQDTSASQSLELSRNEKKARKALEGLGLKKIEGIERVVLKRPRGILLVVAKPEVYRAPGSDTYIVFGEAKPEDNAAQLAAQQQVAASQQAAQASMAAGGFEDNGAPKSLEDLLAEDEAPQLVDSDKKEDTSSSAAEPDAENVKLVMAQAECSEEQAKAALKKADGDLITAIMHAQS